MGILETDELSDCRSALCFLSFVGGFFVLCVKFLFRTCIATSSMALPNGTDRDNHDSKRPQLFWPWHLTGGHRGNGASAVPTAVVLISINALRSRIVCFFDFTSCF
ncbi:hypothetical protein N9A68_01610 [Cyclobacteriaceae bacterium]|nr:hypothetical protein [Cyclobacteriaceae bacterium]MDC6483932.1 hypothetical protein [Cyclobacteriaceae bacterium]